jgi:hypothetical protein
MAASTNSSLAKTIIVDPEPFESEEQDCSSRVFTSGTVDRRSDGRSSGRSDRSYSNLHEKNCTGDSRDDCAIEVDSEDGWTDEDETTRDGDSYGACSFERINSALKPTLGPSLLSQRLNSNKHTKSQPETTFRCKPTATRSHVTTDKAVTREVEAATVDTPTLSQSTTTTAITLNTYSSVTQPCPARAAMVQRELTGSLRQNLLRERRPAIPPVTSSQKASRRSGSSKNHAIAGGNWCDFWGDDYNRYGW